jgi:hypothetical protein
MVGSTVGDGVCDGVCDGVGDGVVVGRGVNVDTDTLVGGGVMVGAGSGVLSCAVQAASKKNKTNRVAIFIVFVCDFISIDIGLQ